MILGKLKKRITGAAVLSLVLCTLLFSPMNAFASEGSDGSNNTNNTNNANNADNAVNTGQTLYNALSRIYGNGGMNGSGYDPNNTNNANNANNNVYYNNGNYYANNGNGTNNNNQKQVPIQDQIMQGMESEVKGPSVDEGGLSEYYHQNYRVYEESLNDDVSIFTNVANGSVVNRPVVVDIPDGVVARMKRDGKSVNVASEEPITEPGSYVLTLFVISEDQENVPFSEQKISKAKFRFRIQYETGVAGFDAIEGEADLSSPSSSESIPNIPGVPEVSGNTLPSVSGNASLLFGEEDDNYLPDDLRPDDYQYDVKEEAAETPEEEAGEEEEKRTSAEDAFLAANGMNGVYDANSGYYKNTLITKDYFYTNVPNGMLTNEPVMIQPADNLIFTVYKDGEVMEDYESGQYLRDDGSYTVMVSGKGESFESTYADNPPIFRFRIITDPVSDLGVLNAPENMTFRSVRYEGEDISKRAVVRPDMVRLIDDGSYEITMDSPHGSTELLLSLDTLQPLFDVDVKPNLATITYRTGDVDHCILYKNDELISNKVVVGEIKEAGKYTLTAYDKAGNKSTASFRVAYRINAGAVFAILIAIGIIGAGAYYMVRIRKKVNIR